MTSPTPDIPTLAGPAWLPMTCEMCGAEYSAPRHRVAKGQGRTCSQACGRKKAVMQYKESRPTPSDADIIEALWSLVRKEGPDDCWPWTGRSTIKRDGRGILNFRGFRAIASRVAWRAAHGRWPEPDQYVCHSCDNPPCCNPAHLWLGTHADNMRDMGGKGRTNPALTKQHGWQKSLTHCMHGHALSGDNLMTNDLGWRRCRTCNRERSKLRRERMKELKHG